MATDGGDDLTYVLHRDGHHSHRHAHGIHAAHHHRHRHDGSEQAHRHDPAHTLHADHPDHGQRHHRHADKPPKKRAARDKATGAITTGFHEGSRSEYLAQYVFSSFGTAVPVPRQEDSGIDMHCTLVERIGRLSWPVAYYSVQVKSDTGVWKLEGPASVKWLIEYPLPLFLCIVVKSEARCLIYHTTPRFEAWVRRELPNRLELHLGRESKARTVGWGTGDTFKLNAPILSFTIEEVLDKNRCAQVESALKFWIGHDLENLFRIRSGLPYFSVPMEYETNKTEITGWSGRGGPFSEELLRLAHRRLNELLNRLTTHHRRNNDLMPAVLMSMVLRHLDPDGPQDYILHAWLNQLFGCSKYTQEAIDSLLNMVKDTLAQHEIADATAPEKPRATRQGT